MGKKWSEIDSISEATGTHEFLVFKEGESNRISKEDFLKEISALNFFKYEESVQVPILTENPTFTQVNTLAFTGLQVGKYKVSLSMIYNFYASTDTAIFRFRMNEGTWLTILVPPESANGINTKTYDFVFDNLTVSDFLLEVESARTDGSGTLQVIQQTLSIERKA